MTHNWYLFFQKFRVVAPVVVVVVGAVVVVVARACRLWNHSIIEFGFPCCCCCCYQFSARSDHFKIFDDVTATPSPLRLVATGNLYFRNLRIEFRLCTNFQHDWSISKFSMTSWTHSRPIPSLSLGTFIFLIYIQKLVSVPISAWSQHFEIFDDVADHALLDRQTVRCYLIIHVILGKCILGTRQPLGLLFSDVWRHPWISPKKVTQKLLFSSTPV